MTSLWIWRLLERAKHLWIAMGLLLCLQAQAALNITPPQLAPDQNGIISTEVKSSLSTATRWSVRVIKWDPTSAADPAAPAVLTAPTTSITPATPSTPTASLGPNAAPLKTLPVSALAESSALPDVQISPRFFSLAASGRQVIRARVMDRSQHYRLLIEQIPGDAITGQGINFRFRFSLPIYTSNRDPLIPRGVLIQ